MGYQKCLTILRVTLLRNHMSTGLIFVNYDPTSFWEPCQYSHIKSPPWVVCLLQSRHRSLDWEGMGVVSALNHNLIKNSQHWSWHLGLTSQQRTLSPTFLCRFCLSSSLWSTMARKREKKQERWRSRGETRKRKGNKIIIWPGCISVHFC